MALRCQCYSHLGLVEALHSKEDRNSSGGLVFPGGALTGEQPLGASVINSGVEIQLLLALKGGFDTVRREATRANGLETAEKCSCTKKLR